MRFYVGLLAKEAQGPQGVPPRQRAAPPPMPAAPAGACLECKGLRVETITSGVISCAHTSRRVFVRAHARTSGLDMGNAQRRLSDGDVGAELRVLADASYPIPRRTQAFLKLRDHFCPPPEPRQQQAAVAAVDAQRFALWPAPPPDASSLDRIRLADRVRGLVFGAALGDATGLATEFLSRAEVDDFYGPGFEFAPQPPRLRPDTHRVMWCAGDWTDDTDQLVLVLQSLLHCEGRTDARDFARRLADWRDRGFPELGDESAAGLGQATKTVLAHPDFARAPAAAAEAVWRGAGGRNASNGAVMRTAVTGVAEFWDRGRVAANTAALCRATHADPRCVASCVAVAACVAGLLRGALDGGGDGVEALIAGAVREAADSVAGPVEPGPADPPASTDAVQGPVPTPGLHPDPLLDASSVPALSLDTAEPEHARLEACVRGLEDAAAPCLALRDLALDEPRAIGYTYKCLAAGLWALRAADTGADFATAIRALVAEGGDADTNAAVGGALLGCRLGFSALPGEWVAQLPHRAWLEAHVQKLLVMLRVTGPAASDSGR